MSIAEPPSPTTSASVTSIPPKSDQRLRTRRIRVEDLKLGRITALARRAELALEAVVEDSVTPGRRVGRSQLPALELAHPRRG